MKHLFSINELFDVESGVDATVIKSTMNVNSDYDSADIDILIDDIPYRFKTCMKDFGDGNYIYLSYHILEHKKHLTDKSKKEDDLYNFIVNKSMTVKVLNALSLFVEEYKRLLFKYDDVLINGQIKDYKNTLIKGFYYDADEERRRRIYKYYFMNKLGDKLESCEKGESYFIFAKLKNPILLKDLYL